MKFSVIIVNYNGGTHIKRCMDTIAAQTVRDFEVLIVDNASTDGSQNTAVPDDRFRWIHAGSNLGFAAGNNRAAKEAKGEWLLMINPDAFPEAECFAVLQSATLRHPDCVLFGCTQLNDKVPEILDGTGDCYTFFGFPYRAGKGWPVDILPDEGEIFGPCGAATLIRKDIFEKMGGYDEDYFCYCEDVDLSFRMRLQGYTAIQVSEAFVRHAGSAISGADSYFSLFHGARNCLSLFITNMPWPLFWLLLPFHMGVTILRLCHPKKFKARWDGICAALKSLPKLMEKRKRIQGSRTVPVLNIARAFTWDIKTLFWRRPDVRRLKH